MVSGVMRSLSWAGPNCNTFGLVVGEVDFFFFFLNSLSALQKPSYEIKVI